MVQQTKQQRPNFGGFVSLLTPLWLVALVLNDDERETWLRAFLSNGGRRTRLHRFSPRDTTYVTQRSVAQPRLTVCQKQCALEQTQTQNELSDNHSHQSGDLFASSAFPQGDTENVRHTDVGFNFESCDQFSVTYDIFINKHPAFRAS